MTGSARVAATNAICESDILRVENARLRSEIGRLRRNQQTGSTTDSLNYVMERSNCLLWHASIKEADDPIYLEWNVSPVSCDWAQRFFPLEVLEGEDYWQAFYRARLTEDLEPALVPPATSSFGMLSSVSARARLEALRHPVRSAV